jgi:hypothetical protein
VSGQPRVVGPHACKGLSHRTEGAFHRARLGRPATGGKLACSVALGKDLLEKDGVAVSSEPRVDEVIVEKVGPDLPVIVVGDGSERNDSGSGRCLRSAEVTEESIAGGGCTKRQDAVC